MEKQQENDGLRVFLAGLACGAGGFALSEWFRSERKRSRAERENPELAEEVFEEITQLLESTVVSEVGDEQGFHDALFRHIDKHSQFNLESGPHTEFGVPDIFGRKHGCS